MINNYRGTGAVFADISRIFTALLIVAVFALFESGCGQPMGEMSKSVSAPWCGFHENKAELQALLNNSNITNGWDFVGTQFNNKFHNTPMGKYDNQLVRNLDVPEGAVTVDIKLPVSASVSNSYMMLDIIWYSGSQEVEHKVTSILVGDVLTGLIAALEPVPADANRLVLSARPWREVDGILTIHKGEVVWCTK